MSKHGVPWEYALACDDVMRAALCIIVGELEGGVFDWARMDWREEV